MGKIRYFCSVLSLALAVLNVSVGLVFADQPFDPAVVDAEGDIRNESEKATLEAKALELKNAAGAQAVENGNQRFSVLPSTEFTVVQCRKLMNIIAMWRRDERDYLFGDRSHQFSDQGMSFVQSDVLACGIKTGDIKLWMVPYFVRQFLEFVIQLSGLIAVGGIIYGGYLYMFAGLTEDKEKGKKAIMYSIGGMILTMVAWAFVNIVISIVT